MSRPPLSQQLEAIEYGPAAKALFDSLIGVSAADENGAVVLVAAAVLLARQHPGETPKDGAALMGLTEEFGDLVFNVRAEMQGPTGRSAGLRLVGGTDVCR
ncbi:hypothetical protein [Fuscovulum blasticum]|uniref:hypothetical protein n=1 Tax=Fuscovulum blasticum TaxID=1075 RepID=UPI000D3E6D8C|nr:hypothetical protein [Fuscovulum blasticum]AWD21586.1 hypothetical protein B6K69_07790 [Fuscovulum blasticum]